MIRKLLHGVAIIATLAGLSAGAITLSAGAASAKPLTEICNNPDPLFGYQCANVSGGNYLLNNPVIAWDYGDSNNSFQFEGTSLCGHGYVTTTCPFTVGSGLNNAYVGDQIVEVVNNLSGYCIGLTSSNAIASTLQECGSGWGTYQILQFSNPGPGNGFTPYNVMVNRNWSDNNWAMHNTNGCYGVVCSSVVGMPGHGKQLYMAQSDINVERGDFAHALPADQWAEES